MSESRDTIRVFTHGILVDSGTMRSFAPGADRVGSAALPGWRNADVRPADIEEAPGETAIGVVWDVPIGEMPALDELEGVGRDFYEHVTVEPVLVATGEETAATAYRMVRRARLREARERYRRECDEGVELLADRGDL